VVTAAVTGKQALFVEDAAFLRHDPAPSITWYMPEPMTMVDTLYAAHYGSRRDLAWEFAAILKQEAKELAAAGVDIVQFDEPAFNVFFEDVKSLGLAALERAAEGLECGTAGHIY